MSDDEEPKWTPELFGSKQIDPALAKRLRDDSVEGLKALGVDMSAFEEDGDE